MVRQQQSGVGKQIIIGVSVGIILAVATGATSPWWWSKIFRNNDRLKSDVGASYEELESHLKKGDFEKADQETAKQLLWLANREEEGKLYLGDFDHSRCTDLETIDNLWNEYSGGKFGFSIQRKIWLSLGGKRGDRSSEIYEKFAEKVGWQSSPNLIYALRAPEGHLPTDLTAILNSDKLYEIIIVDSRCVL